MANPFVSTPIIADKAESPLLPDTTQSDAPGVVLSERFGTAICDVAAWPDCTTKTVNAIKRATSLALTTRQGALSDTAQAFQHAPARWTVISTDQLMPETLTKAVGDNATVVDLSHGRTIIRIDGADAEWVLSKLFAIDFALAAFPVSKGIATQHHEIFALIQRIDDDAFDIIVFRSYARAFWHALTQAARDVGYAVE